MMDVICGLMEDLESVYIALMKKKEDILPLSTFPPPDSRGAGRMPRYGLLNTNI